MSAQIKLPEPAITTIPRSARDLLWQMVRPFWKKSLLFFLLTFLGMVAWTASPVVIAEIINKLGDDATVTNKIWQLAGLYAILRFIDEILWRLGEAVMRSYKPQMVESVRTRLFAATLKKPYSFFVNSSSGRIGHWINQTVTTTNDFVDTTIWTVWGSAIGLIISAVFLFAAHWSLAILFLVWLILLFWYNIRRGEAFGKLVALQSDETSKASGLVVDSIGNHLSVRVFGAQQHEQDLLMKQQRTIVHRWRDSWWQNLGTNTVKGQSAAIVSIIALALTLVLFSRGQIQVGGIVLIITYFGNASGSLWQLAWAFDSYFRHFGTIQNALDGLGGKDERQPNSSTRNIPPKEVSIELKHIRFAYPEQIDDKVLTSLDLTIHAGQKVGVVGHSGAGKSTLLGLLLGFYEPDEGDIIVNGKSVIDRGPSYIRSLSSFVPQDTSLFNRSVKDNVIYAKPTASETELIAALQQAQAYDFVDKLPDGLNTIIGERGVKLSGGQRQRIAIARAILQNAPLLLLDEATSALDSVSEQAIQKALYGLMKNRTSIVIAHRLSTIKHLDHIIVLNKGAIAEQGTHDELVKLKGIYADLWKRQKDGFIVD